MSLLIQRLFPCTCNNYYSGDDAHLLRVYNYQGERKLTHNYYEMVSRNEIYNLVNTEFLNTH